MAKSQALISDQGDQSQFLILDTLETAWFLDTGSPWSARCIIHGILKGKPSYCCGVRSSMLLVTKFKISRMPIITVNAMKPVL
jgi:hypothetical protein